MSSTLREGPQCHYDREANRSERHHRAAGYRPSGSDHHDRGHDRRRGQNVANGAERLGPRTEDDIGQLIREYLQSEDKRKEEPGLSQSPFTPHIRFARNPLDFKLPTMRPYDGKFDPLVHLLKYEQHMEVAGASEEIM